MSEIEKAIYNVHGFSKCLRKTGREDNNNLANEIDAILTAFQDKQERGKGWIPCSERMPAVRDGSLAYNELFLVTANIEDRVYTYLAYYSSCSGFAGLFGGDWNEHVTAWQPLPEPYEEGDNNG